MRPSLLPTPFVFFCKVEVWCIIVSTLAPVLVKTPGNTSAAFDGYWETIAVQQTPVWDESSVIFSAYRCDVGNPFGESLRPCPLRKTSLVAVYCGARLGL